jgi:hypothetical protein
MAATDSVPIIKVLFTLHEGMDALDFIGPLEVLSHAKHNTNDDCKSMAEISVDSDLSMLIYCNPTIPSLLLESFLLTANKADSYPSRSH